MNQPEATTLILIGLAAFGLPIVARRILIPGVVLEILFGILVGPVLHLVEPSAFIDALAELGFLLLLFLSGFEIDLRFFEHQGARSVGTGLGVFALTLAGSLAASRALDLDIFMTLVLATTSVGLVVPTLRATRWISTRLGQDILVNALLADFLTLLAVTGFAVVSEFGGGVRLLVLPAFFAIVGVALLALRRAAWWRPDPFMRLFGDDDPDELGIRATLALMFVFVAVSLGLGIEPVLGAFLAGVIFAAVFRNRGSLDRKLDGIAYGFLIPVFFISIGIGFELDALTDPTSLRLALVLLGVALAVKIVPSLLLLLRGHRLREVIAGGVLLSARLSLIIVVAEVGVELGLITPTMEGTIILLAAATATISPALFRWIAPSQPARSGMQMDRIR